MTDGRTIWTSGPDHITIAGDPLMHEAARIGHTLAQARQETLTAHDLIGYEGPDYVRIVGGRTLYEGVMVPASGYDGGNVRLARIVADARGLRQINRYVDPDTPVELVPTTTEETR